ncbi:hypothetical protein Tco_0231357 [Tanacetum coccineum]
MLCIRSGLWLCQTKNRKCLKPQATYSFTPENQKTFCQYIKRVKLPDGFGSCFQHKVTDNDTSITGLKSHDCHIMMQRLLPYGLQNYLPDKIAKPIIKLSSLFKQICSVTLMEDDMLKAQINVVDILCELHISSAKPEGLIAEGYVTEEALTFSSHYFQDVTMKFNGPDRNVDPPPPTCQFQVFRSVYKSIGLRSFIWFYVQELKKVKWYVLHNSLEIDTYQSLFKSLFPNKDMQEEFPNYFGSQIRQRHVDNDQDLEVSTTNELFALANGPSWTPTQNNDICSPGLDREMYYGKIQQILEFKYLLFKVALFRGKWFDTSNKGRKVNKLVLRNNMTQIDCSREAFKDDQYILVTQVKQVFYLKDKTKPHWKVVEHVNHKKFSDGGVIVVEDDPDIIHFDNSSDLPLSTSLNDLNNATLHIDGQSTVVDAPPDIIDVPDEDDDIIDDEDALPYDLADSDVEDLINVDDDGAEKMSLANVARSHRGDGGGDDRPPSHVVPTGYGGCFANKGKVEESLNVTFDETPPPPKTSPLEDDELVEEEAIEVSKTKPIGNDLEDISLENNQIVNIKESKTHPLENVIGLWYPKGSGIETIVYADSDHTRDYVDRKSTSGVCTFMGCCLTSWFLKKQTALAIFTTEAEYVSAGKACQQALWMKQALVDYGIRLDDIPIMCDNKGAIDLSKNPVQHSRTKHIEIRTTSFVIMFKKGISQ